APPPPLLAADGGVVVCEVMEVPPAEGQGAWLRRHASSCGLGQRLGGKTIDSMRPSPGPLNVTALGKIGVNRNDRNKRLGASWTPVRGLRAPGFRSFRLAERLTFGIHLSHERAVCEHTNDAPPVLGTNCGRLEVQRTFQRLNAPSKGFKGQFI